MKTLEAPAVMLLFIFTVVINTVPGEGRRALRSSDAEQHGTNEAIKMDLYPNSIDDAFTGCEDKTYKKITKEDLLEKELKRNDNFQKAWNEAKLKFNVTTQCGQRNAALYAYTTKHIYKDLNDKMRTGKNNYLTGFGLISLHFMISNAIQFLNPNNKCQTTYHRTKEDIESETVVRFGSFASSSLLSSLKQFGSETCFIISTCYGANITKFSKFPKQKEVLIPPYEKFKCETVKIKPPELDDCKRVYKLQSSGTMSNMKCVYVK